MHAWEFEKSGETLRIDPKGPVVAGFGGATDFAVQVAVAGCGIIYLFKDWLQPQLDSGELVPVLQPWWSSLSGPFLYYPGRLYLPTPLRAFVDFLKAKSRGRGQRRSADYAT